MATESAAVEAKVLELPKLIPVTAPRMSFYAGLPAWKVRCGQIMNNWYDFYAGVGSREDNVPSDPEQMRYIGAGVNGGEVVAANAAPAPAEPEPQDTTIYLSDLKPSNVEGLDTRRGGVARKVRINGVKYGHGIWAQPSENQGSCRISFRLE